MRKLIKSLFVIVGIAAIAGGAYEAYSTYVERKES